VLGNEYEGQSCSIARALEAIGERWTLLIVRELLHRPRRFAELERRLAIAKNVLSARLEKLVRLGVVETTPVDELRDWNVYRLTRRGRDLFPVISALMAWGDTYFAPQGAPALFQHSCGKPAGHHLMCEACGDSVDADSIIGIPGPGYVVSGKT
jgi:DNA-binding HxlR family transcriptional regulator